MFLTAVLSDDEIAAICRPLKQPAAQLRHIRRLGIPAERRPDGTVLVLRCDYERGLRKPGNDPQWHR